MGGEAPAMCWQFSSGHVSESDQDRRCLLSVPQRLTASSIIGNEDRRGERGWRGYAKAQNILIPRALTGEWSVWERRARHHRGAEWQRVEGRSI